ncbi:PA domain-containing protein [Solirubrobacter pauli]|uniref:PA domain-containing protein n=1 Tax=Solirubrobacter pauli TaxID=166793 RepID=A0A660L3Z8_9ACTN|nr:S8 family serine peptidase [Solirubrobacter pauli]RKQ86633.1 PA domain-containing protein [Solirubrobacter pauli]
MAEGDEGRHTDAAAGGEPAPGGAAPGGKPPAAGGEAAAPGGPALPGGPGGLLARLRRAPKAVLAGGAVVLVALVVLVVALLSGGAGPLPDVTPPKAASLADPVPYDGRSPIQARSGEQRVLVEFDRPALGKRENARTMGAEAQRDYVDELKREATTTRSALQANGVVLRDVVAFYRVWNGFAATVRTRDLPKLAARRLNVRTVRRAYPASGEPVSVPDKPSLKRAGLGGQAPIAVLDTGVDAGALAGHADPGYDAVERDRDPAPGTDPSGEKRKETSGTALASILAAAGERVMPIRVASLRADGGTVTAETTTDQIIAGLEHAVDPNGDRDTSDHVPVALVGVNAPYAGFSDTPEAQAVEGAAGLGTLTIAPAGNEGAAKPGSGTVGSPASAPQALAVGALAGPEPAARTELDADGTKLDAAMLAGTPPRDGTTAGPIDDTSAEALTAVATRLRGKVVIVKANENPAAQAAAVAAAGARAVVLAMTDDGEPLPAISAGRAAAPVIGVTGEAAEALLDAEPGKPITFGTPKRGPRGETETTRASTFTAQGPSAGGLPKPDLAAPGSALTAVGVSGGTAVAAANVAIQAARLSRARPELTPEQLRATLIAAGQPHDLPPDRAGAGVVAEPTSGVTADPPTAESGPLDPVTIELNAANTTPVTLTATGGAVPTPNALTLTPGAPAAINIRLPKPGTTTGRLEARNGNAVVASVPWLIHPDDVEPIAVGEPKIDRGGRRVRFTLGRFQRGPQTEVQVAEKLILDLVDGDGKPRRTLTFRGGARELMPAEYAYTLPAGTRDGLTFRIRAWAPNQDEPTTRTAR